VYSKANSALNCGLPAKGKIYKEVVVQLACVTLMAFVWGWRSGFQKVLNICLLSMVERCFVRFVQRLAYCILVDLPRCGQHMWTERHHWASSTSSMSF